MQQFRAFFQRPMADLDSVAVINEAISVFNASVNAASEILRLNQLLATQSAVIDNLTRDLKDAMAVCTELTESLNATAAEKPRVQIAHDEMVCENEKLVAELKEQGEKIRALQTDQAKSTERLLSYVIGH